MKRFMGLIAAGLLVLAQVGCQGVTSRKSYAQANDAFIATVTTLNTAYDADTFTPEEWEEDIEPVITTVNQLMREYDAMTAAGFEGDTVLEQIRFLLDRLRPFLLEAGAHFGD